MTAIYRTKYPSRTLTVSQAREKRVESISHRLITNALLSRAELASVMGKSFGTDRDVYAQMGYDKTLRFRDYAWRFTRQGIAKRIITAYPEATWRTVPEVIETHSSDLTDFEKQWRNLAMNLSVFYYLNRLDKICGIGRYGLLYLGLNDGKDPAEAVAPNDGLELMYMQPYSEGNAAVKTFVKERKDPRFGLPETYQVKVNFETDAIASEMVDPSHSSATKSHTMIVHWSRVLHAIDGAVESDVYGTPRLEHVWNDLQDLDLIGSGSAEMFWRNAFPGLALEADPGAILEDEDDLEDEIEDYVHGLTRVMRLRGLKVNPLKPEIGDPKEHFEMKMSLISGATGIPKRILMGTERGELASQQDKENWEDRVDERRKNFAEPILLRPFIDRLIDLKVLPSPKGEEDGEEGYSVVWPDIEALNETDQAKVGEQRAKAIKDYLDSGGENVLPIKQFLMLILGFSQPKAQAIIDELIEQIEDEELDVEPEPEPEPPVENKKKRKSSKNRKK